MQELRADESVDVVLVAGGGRLDWLCREVAASAGHALLADDRGVCGLATMGVDGVTYEEVGMNEEHAVGVVEQVEASGGGVAERVELVARYLADHPGGQSVSAIAAGTGVSVVRLRRVLERMRADGRVAMSGTRRTAVYEMADGDGPVGVVQADGAEVRS